MARFSLVVLVFILLIDSFLNEAEAEAIIPYFTGGDATLEEFEEIECLALNIYHEARGELIIGQRYVAQVTINRVNSKKFKANTICDVVFQNRQFSWTHDGRSDAVDDIDAWNIASLIAINFVLFEDSVLDDMSSDYLWYYNPKKADPAWADGLVFRKIGNHLFLRDKSSNIILLKID